MWNRHRESELHDIHEIGSGTKLYYLWVKGYSTWEERDTIFLCWLLLYRQLSTQPTRGTPSAPIRLASPSFESRLSRSKAGTQLLLFSNPPNPQRFRAWRHSPPTVPFPLWDFYFDISEWHILSACAWTPALMLYLTNPCTKRKVLILTKLKGKIYKTKSLRHYSTTFYKEYLTDKQENEKKGGDISLLLHIIFRHMTANDTNEKDAYKHGNITKNPCFFRVNQILIICWINFTLYVSKVGLAK